MDTDYCIECGAEVEAHLLTDGKCDDCYEDWLFVDEPGDW